MPALKPRSVAWCTLPGPESEIDTSSVPPPHLEAAAGPGLLLHPCCLPDLEHLEVDAAVLDARAVPTVDVLRDAVGRLPFPVLLLASPVTAPNLIPALRPEDDIALLEEPSFLLSHRLLRLALAFQRDDLTGLLNRRAFADRLELHLRSVSAAQPLSLLMVDLDHFKMFNDRNGHEAGDQLLRELGRLMLAKVDPEVVVARVGGGMLALLLPETDEGASLDYAGLLCEIVRDQTFSGDARVTVSIGSSTTEVPGSQDELMRQADEALYAAKAEGRNRASHFRALERRALEAGRDVRIDAFEHMQRVIHDRQAEVLARRSRRLFESLQVQADRDGLTGLFNRRYLDRRLEHDHQEAQRSVRRLSVALIDVDLFGRVNKDFGWPTGDLALQEVSRLVSQQVRSGDQVGKSHRSPGQK